MSDERKSVERERARERYRADGGAQARRCYIRHLKKGNIKKPRPETMARWGVEESDYIFVAAPKGGCHHQEMA